MAETNIVVEGGGGSDSVWSNGGNGSNGGGVDPSGSADSGGSSRGRRAHHATTRRDVDASAAAAVFDGQFSDTASGQAQNSESSPSKQPAPRRRRKPAAARSTPSTDHDPAPTPLTVTDDNPAPTPLTVADDDDTAPTPATAATSTPAAAPARARHLVQIDEAEAVFARERAQAEAARMAKKNKASVKHNELDYDAQEQRAKTRYKMQLGLGVNKDEARTERKEVTRRLEKSHVGSTKNQLLKYSGVGQLTSGYKEAKKNHKDQKEALYEKRGVNREKDLRHEFNKHDSAGTQNIVAKVVPGARAAIGTARDLNNLDNHDGARGAKGQRQIAEHVGEDVEHGANYFRLGLMGAGELSDKVPMDEIPFIGAFAAGADLGLKADRAGEMMHLQQEQTKILRDTPKTAENLGTRTALKNFIRTEREVTAHAGVDCVADGAKITGDAISASGIGAPIGVGVRAAGTATGLINAGAEFGGEWNHQRQAVNARKRMERKPGDYTAADEERDGQKRIGQDLQLSSQIMINEAREELKKDPQNAGPALQTMKSFGISPTLLADDDKEVRKLLVSTMGKKDERAETLSKTVAQSSVGRMVVKKGSDSDEITALAQAKDLLSYGGKSDRGDGYAKDHKLMKDVEGRKAQLLLEFRRMQDESLQSGGRTPGHDQAKAAQVEALLRPWYAKEAEEKQAKQDGYAARTVKPNPPPAVAQPQSKDSGTKKKNLFSGLFD